MSRLILSCLFCLTWSAWSLAAEHRVEVLPEGPPADGVSDELRQQLADEGLKVIRGSSRTVCEIWPAKQWQAPADFEPTFDRLYPFQPGQLIGLLRFPRRGNDFRDQQISSDIYTLRYALQPIDGNHVGTSPTRDFLLMVKVEEDAVGKAWKPDDLHGASAAAAGSTHPAMLCLQKARDGVEEPAMRHHEERDWWILQFTGQAASDGKTRPLPVAVVVVGYAEE